MNIPPPRYSGEIRFEITMFYHRSDKGRVFIYFSDLEIILKLAAELEMACEQEGLSLDLTAKHERAAKIMLLLHEGNLWNEEYLKCEVCELLECKWYPTILGF